MAIGDYKVCIDEANAFLHTAESCIKGDYMSLLSGKMYPFVVNAAFSCELYIKGIMIHNSANMEFETGHNLKNLFSQLNTTEQTAIKTLYDQKSTQDIYEFLNESGNAFAEWRYALEKGVNINITSLRAFAHALKEYVTGLT